MGARLYRCLENLLHYRTHENRDAPLGGDRQQSRKHAPIVELVLGLHRARKDSSTAGRISQAKISQRAAAHVAVGKSVCLLSKVSCRSDVETCAASAPDLDARAIPA